MTSICTPSMIWLALCMPQRQRGKVRWLSQLARYKNEKKKNGAIFWSGPVLAGDKLWFVNSNGEVFSAGVSDGQPVLVTDLKSPITLAPVVANNTLYILDDSGKITALR